jgi:S1-C subfamily serine protease
VPTNLSLKSGLLLFAVMFCGVFAALWVDRSLESRKPVMTVGADTGPGTEVGGPFDFTEASRRVMPSVVSIDTINHTESFLGESISQPGGSGSGVVVQADGYIVTNAHVVRDPNNRMSVVAADIVKVRTSDGRGYDAKVVGIDALSDLAVIKIEGASLVAATFGDSDQLQIGDWVLAVGNQLGFDNSVSVGVVSSKNRWISTSDDSVLIDAIQTDATINKGNSGGALCNSRGEVIGINSSIATFQGVSAGVGFAVPSKHVGRAVNDLIDYGFVRYAVLGIELMGPQLSLAIPRDRQLLAEVTKSKEPPSYGVVVAVSDPALPAYKAGVRELDVILEVDGRRMESNIDFVRATMEKNPGDEVEIKLWSRGRTKTVNVELASRSR